LQPPEIQYKGAKASPGTSGRWDLRGKKFFLANSEPLTSWGVCVVHSCVPETTVRHFLNVFIQTYIGHGGVVKNKDPIIYMQERGGDVAEAVVATRTAAGNQSDSLPQILMFVLPGRDSFMYERIKKNMECRFGMFSQSMHLFCKPSNHVTDLFSDERGPHRQGFAPVLF
jgi:eukaryotic translation initiation factor 2C